MNGQYLIELNEVDMSFKLLIIDGINMGVVERTKEVKDTPNKFSGKAWFTKSGKLEWKTNLIDGDSDLDFNRYLNHLKSLPKYEDHKSKIKKFWKNNNN